VGYSMHRKTGLRAKLRFAQSSPESKDIRSNKVALLTQHTIEEKPSSTQNKEVDTRR
jgi:hypothetical protein